MSKNVGAENAADAVSSYLHKSCIAPQAVLVASGCKMVRITEFLTEGATGHFPLVRYSRGGSYQPQPLPFFLHLGRVLEKHVVFSPAVEYSATRATPVGKQVPQPTD